MSGPLKKVQGKQIKPNFTEKVTAPEVEAEVKYFGIGHPSIKNMDLVHSCLEGPEIGIYYRGKNDKLNIYLPDYFKGLIDYNTITVHLTPIGEYCPLYVSSINENENCIKIGIPLFNNKKPLLYSFIVYAERKDKPKLNIVQDKPKYYTKPYKKKKSIFLKILNIFKS